MVDSETIFSILMPLTIVKGPALIIIDAFPMFLAIYKLPLIFLPADVQIASLAIEFVIFPTSHVNVLIREAVDPSSVSILVVLPDVLASIRV